MTKEADSKGVKKGVEEGTANAGADVSADRQIDLRGLNCPLPVLKTKKALSEMQPGQILHAITTDPMSVIDFTVFCERAGHDLLNKTEDDEEFGFWIRRD